MNGLLKSEEGPSKVSPSLSDVQPHFIGTAVIATTSTILLGFWIAALFISHLRSSDGGEKPVRFICTPPSVNLLPSLYACLKDDGETTDSQSSPPRIQCYAPATGKWLAQIKAASCQDIDECMSRAKHAQKDWQGVSWAAKRKVLKTIQK
ncbi:MAG: hypothetical protein Q9159_002426 [Coniocarpon cinnabarinum]